MSNNHSARLSEVLIRPLVTEKATALAAGNQYTFEVDPKANKIELKKAFEQVFAGRTVTNVQTVKMYARSKRFGRKTGYTSPGKKAIFTIQGEPIELFTGV